MDDLLPTYESATEKTPWRLVAPYLSSGDLCSAALVSQKWHDAFAPQLWGDPTSHFGPRSSGYEFQLYDRFRRFRRTLFSARLRVRELTHSLHFPHTLSENDVPDKFWLSDLLEHLSRLQSLTVHRLSWLDHASLKATSTYSRISKQWQGRPTYALRLLDASSCPNVTASGLAEALQYLPDLVFLDLSGTYALNHEVSFLRKLETLSNLRVLNLRRMNLKNAALEIIAQSIGTRVRSLDLRDNQLTNQAIHLLVEYCFSKVELTRPGVTGPNTGSGTFTELDVSGNEHLEAYFRKKLGHGFAGHLATDDEAPIGITHLYLSGNSIKPEVLPELFLPEGLQVLDVGGLPLPYDFHADPMVHAFLLPGIEMLTPVIKRCAQDRLTYLRINHGIVTKDVPSYIDQNLEDNLEMEKPGHFESLHNSTDEVERRQRRMRMRQAKEHHLHPAMLSRLRTLVLTDVPLKTRTVMVVSRLIQFIKDCAEETEIAKLRANSTYALPPGRSRAVAEREHARGLFGLRRIVLEMAHQPTWNREAASSLSEPSGSFTGDADADVFWKAADEDFSFFGEGERGSGGEVHRPAPPPNSGRLGGRAEDRPTQYDVLAEISSFRKSRKAVYQAAIGSGDSAPDIEGYWPGELTVIQRKSCQE